VLIPCRDGEDVLPLTLQSLINQNVETRIIVADDASVDSTPDIIKKYGVESVVYPRREPRNYNRVPVLINMAYKAASQTPYYMISGDDNVYPHDYLEYITKWMDWYNVDIASGYNHRYEQTKAPCGGGRVMTAYVMGKLMPLPSNLTWDTWMLFKNRQLGRREAVYPIKKTPIGRPRKVIYSFGHCAHLLGSPLVYTGLRSALEIARGKNWMRSLSILVGHLDYRLRGVRQMEDAPQFRRERMLRLHSMVRSMIRKAIRRRRH
jgi:glycosyltransferase involved in cell wall biosynthesis